MAVQLSFSLLPISHAGPALYPSLQGKRDGLQLPTVGIKQHCALCALETTSFPDDGSMTPSTELHARLWGC